MEFFELHQILRGWSYSLSVWRCSAVRNHYLGWQRRFGCRAAKSAHFYKRPRAC